MMDKLKELKKREGCKFICSVPEGETVVSMVIYQDDIFIATGKHVYKLVDEKRLEVVV